MSVSSFDVLGTLLDRAEDICILLTSACLLQQQNEEVEHDAFRALSTEDERDQFEAQRFHRPQIPLIAQEIVCLCALCRLAPFSFVLVDRISGFCSLSPSSYVPLMPFCICGSVSSCFAASAREPTDFFSSFSVFAVHSFSPAMFVFLLAHD